MLDLDNGPFAMLIWIFTVYTAPFIYSFFVDKFDKNKEGIDTYSKQNVGIARKPCHSVVE